MRRERGRRGWERLKLALARASSLLALDSASDGERGSLGRMNIRTQIDASSLDAWVVAAVESERVARAVGIIRRPTIQARRGAEEAKVDARRQVTGRVEAEHSAVIAPEGVAVHDLTRSVRRKMKRRVGAASRDVERAERGREPQPTALDTVSEAVVKRENAVSLSCRGTEWIPERRVSTRDAGGTFDGAERSPPHIHEAAGGAGAATRKQLDDARDCIRPVDDARRPTDDLDAIEIVRGEGSEVERASRIVQRDAIDEDLHVVALPTTREQRRRGAERSAAHHHQSGDGGERIAHNGDAARPEVVAADDRDGRRRNFELDGNARGGDHHRHKNRRVARLLSEQGCRDEERKSEPNVRDFHRNKLGTGNWELGTGNWERRLVAGSSCWELVVAACCVVIPSEVVESAVSS